MVKILIIDDDPDVRTVMNILMKKNGYDVETASRREEALEKIRSFQPSLVLLDVLLSGADGREICRDIKNNPDTDNIKVVMFSAHPSAVENFASYGADDFITKPINTDLLLEKLGKVVNSGS